MKKEHRYICNKLEEYLNQYPDQRFGQALFNLNIKNLNLLSI